MQQLVNNSVTQDLPLFAVKLTIFLSKITDSASHNPSFLSLLMMMYYYFLNIFS